MASSLETTRDKEKVAPKDTLVKRKALTDDINIGLLEKTPETQKKLESLRKKAEGSETSLIDIQGGFEWLGLSEKNQEQKYSIMAQMYLTEMQDENGVTRFVVNNEIENTYKTKFGIGAGDLLPPSIKKVKITDLNGKTRIGTRDIRDRDNVKARVGYYDENGYIPIFAGYSLESVTSISEESQEYKDAVEEEKNVYLRKKEAEKTSRIKEKGPIASLQDLEKPIEQTAKNITKEQKEQISQAKQDWKNIKFLLKHWGIRLSASSNIEGGHYILRNGKKILEILGWEEKMNDMENTAIKATLTSPPKTVELIKAMQKGEKYMEFDFLGTYELDLKELITLNKLVKNPKELKQILETAKGTSKKIDPSKVIKEIFEPEIIPGNLAGKETFLTSKNSPTGKPLYINTPTNPELRRRPQELIVFFPGDGQTIKKALKRLPILSRVEKLRRQGRNATLVIAGLDTDEDKRDDRWDYFKSEDQPFDKIVSYLSAQNINPREIDFISYSGGYRAVAAILKSTKHYDQIASIDMLDSIFADSDDPIIQELLTYLQKGGKVRAITSAKSKKVGQKVRAAVKTMQRRLKDKSLKGNFKITHTNLSHSQSAKEYFLIADRDKEKEAYQPRTEIAEQTSQELEHILSNNLQREALICTKYGKCKPHAQPGHCERFTGNFMEHLLSKWGAKDKVRVWHSPIAETQTKMLRGKKIADLQESDFESFQPGQVIFMNRADKYTGNDRLIPGTAHKMRKISDKRHWCTFLGFDKQGKARFADNWGPYQSLNRIKRRYRGFNRVVMNIHDPLAQHRKNIVAENGRVKIERKAA